MARTKIEGGPGLKIETWATHSIFEAAIHPDKAGR